MVIHRTTAGDTLAKLARQFKLSPLQLAERNGITEPDRLIPGQALTITPAAESYTVKKGDTLREVARRHRVTLSQLMRLNPALGGHEELYPGQTLALSPADPPLGAMAVNGFVHPSCDMERLYSMLPYLTYLTVCGCRLAEDGTPLPPEDSALVGVARQRGVMPLLQLTSATEGGMEEEKARVCALLESKERQSRLYSVLLGLVRKRGYAGIVADFSFIPEEYTHAYSEFIMHLRRRMAQAGGIVTVTLAAKENGTDACHSPGQDYQILGRAANSAMPMTYDFSSRFDEPSPLAPLDRVRRSAAYAASCVRPAKLLLGLPCGGYDWLAGAPTGVEPARLISCDEVIQTAAEQHAAIMYDKAREAPYLAYRGKEGADRLIWFEDAQSMYAKLKMVHEIGFGGIGLFNVGQLDLSSLGVLGSLFHIVKAYEM